MSKNNKPRLKVMVSSSVYHFRTEIEQLCATLTGFGYEVINSHIGTVYSIPGKSPKESCLEAVRNCDFFLGIVLPFYGSGITEDEFKEAVKLNLPRGFLAHHDVTFARELLKQFMFDDQNKRTDFKLKKKTSVMDNLKVIDMYNIAVGDGLPMNNRLWAQEFYRYSLDGATFINTQFKDEARFRSDLEKIK
ncbi:MAG: DUF4062 domain-containing protein [Bacteroidia bacterium]